MVQSNTLYAPKTGLYLPGSASNDISVPDQAALDITGDICCILDIELPDWSPAGQITLIGKYTGVGDQRSWAFILTTSGTLQIINSASGTSSIVSRVSSTLNFDNNTRQKIAFTLDTDNGGSQSICTFWYLHNNNWTPFSVAAAVNTSIYSSSAVLYLGSLGGASQFVAGTIYSAQVYSGIGDNSAPGLGTLVAEADFSYPWANNKYTDATGKVWTINGSAWAWEYQDDPEDKYGFTGVG